ncbi:MAG: cyclase family protein [Phycisphaerales bacterium]
MTARRLWDITPPISPKLAVWPGDTSPSREVLCTIEGGATVTLSTLRSTVHLGAHADAPLHYGHGAESIESRRLDHYLGPCVVVAASVARGARVHVGDLRGPISESRVLIATGTYPDAERWNEDFAALDPSLVDALHDRGVITVGIDTPSVDLFSSKDLPSHGRFLAHDMAILEGLRLSHVPSGRYELIALPLPLVGFDASPVRAVLRELPPQA